MDFFRGGRKIGEDVVNQGSSVMWVLDRSGTFFFCKDRIHSLYRKTLFGFVNENMVYEEELSPRSWNLYEQVLVFKELNLNN